MLGNLFPIVNFLWCHDFKFIVFVDQLSSNYKVNIQKMQKLIFFTSKVKSLKYSDLNCLLGMLFKEQTITPHKLLNLSYNHSKWIIQIIYLIGKGSYQKYTNFKRFFNFFIITKIYLIIWCKIHVYKNWNKISLFFNISLHLYIPLLFFFKPMVFLELWV